MHDLAQFDSEVAKAVCSCVIVDEFDYESLELDVALFGEVGDSNLFRATKRSVSAMARLQHLTRLLRVTARCFSTGFLFWYWPYYGTEEAENIKQRDAYEGVDFGGFSIRETFVKPYFGSFKEEVLESALIDIKQFNHPFGVRDGVSQRPKPSQKV